MDIYGREVWLVTQIHQPHKNNTKPEDMWFKKYQNSRLAVNCKNNILNPSINRNAAIPCELRGSRRNLKTVFDLFEIWPSCFNWGLPKFYSAFHGSFFLFSSIFMLIFLDLGNCSKFWQKKRRLQLRYFFRCFKSFKLKYILIFFCW